MSQYITDGHSVTDIQYALDLIMDACKAAPNNSGLQYAAAYTQAAYGMPRAELNVQILYILNNLQTWRGDVAREVKKFLKAYAGVK